MIVVGALLVIAVQNLAVMLTEGEAGDERRWMSRYSGIRDGRFNAARLTFVFIVVWLIAQLVSAALTGSIWFVFALGIPVYVPSSLYSFKQPGWVIRN